MKIAIAGYGIEGKSSYDYFLNQGNDVTILDQRAEIGSLPDTAKVSLGETALSELDSFDLVIRTPSMSPQQLKNARKVWSATNEFFAKCPAPIIGVTGTKGKGTTCSLIAAILRQSGKTVHLVGNIGVPALDVLKDINEKDIVVYELSSFQLWDLETSPHIAVVLMIEPDHLDVHATFDEYAEAKQNIVYFQKEQDITVFNSENVYAAAIATMSPATKVPVPSEYSAYVKDGYFWYGDRQICPTASLKLPGTFNQNNACAAIAAVWPYVKEPEIIERGLTSFEGLPHRLKFIRSLNNVSYYDDSIATTVGSAIAAMKAFTQPKIVILGGSSKGIINFEDVASTAATANVKAALVIGAQAVRIQEVLEKHGVKNENLGSEVTMKDIVHRASELAVPGDVVILSPACASFDMFKSYADRGDQFIVAVNEL